MTSCMLGFELVAPLDPLQRCEMRSSENHAQDIRNAPSPAKVAMPVRRFFACVPERPLGCTAPKIPFETGFHSVIAPLLRCNHDRNTGCINAVMLIVISP